MLRRYETIFIVRSDVQSDGVNSLVDRYAGIINGLNGTTVKIENWGKRRLAYPIEKMKEGVYVRIDFVAEHKVVIEAERNFKIDDNVLRFQTVKLSDKVDMEEIEREMAEILKKEEERKQEEQKRAEQQKLEEQKKEEVISEPAVSEPAISEPAVSEVVAEESGSEEIKMDDEEVSQETVSVEIDEKKAEEE